MACPYHARHLIHVARGYFDAPTPAEQAQARPGRHGVMTKCDFCQGRVDAGLARGLAPGVDPEATPMCSVACIANAILFGDLDDPGSRVARIVADGEAVPLLPDCGTRPNAFYVVD
jgi:phenylacetyl-CoA:acceptor oxidoreductase subunit 1